MRKGEESPSKGRRERKWENRAVKQRPPVVGIKEEAKLLARPEQSMD